MYTMYYMETTAREFNQRSSQILAAAAARFIERNVAFRLLPDDM